MIDDPWNRKGSKAVKGELDKNGIKYAYIIGLGSSDAKCQLSDDGNKILMDDGYRARVTAARK
jgi:hypothetical protein